MMKLMSKKHSEKGFTLMELLIVIAIIAILIAIAIPVFSGQLEKARETTDAANIRAAYAEVMVGFLDGGDDAITEKDVVCAQTGDGWEKLGDTVLVGDLNVSDLAVGEDVTVTVAVDDNGYVTISAGSTYVSNAPPTGGGGGE